MTSHQINLVQSSFSKVAPIADGAADLFALGLSEIAPGGKPVVRGEGRQQERRPMATLGVVVDGLANPDAVLPTAKATAVKHGGYGFWAASR